MCVKWWFSVLLSKIVESALNTVVSVGGLVFLNLREMLRVKEAGGSVSFAKEMRDLSDDSIRCSSSVWYL